MLRPKSSWPKSSFSASLNFSPSSHTTAKKALSRIPNGSQLADAALSSASFCERERSFVTRVEASGFEPLSAKARNRMYCLM